MVLKDLSDNAINNAGITDLQDTLKCLRDKIEALRRNNIFHITTDNKIRRSSDGTYVLTVELFDLMIDEIIKVIRKN